jgi:hypothetical protein
MGTLSGQPSAADIQTIIQKNSPDISPSPGSENGGGGSPSSGGSSRADVSGGMK